MSVKVEHAGSVVWVLLSRAEKANALDRETVDSLLLALAAAERDEGARVLILMGEGKNFCAGADLAELIDGGSAGVRALLDPLRQFMLRLERSRLITIAAVHGAARAGGLEIALACDVIVAAQSGSFGDAHLANGLIPGGGSTARLPRAVGWQRAKWLILSGQAIDAATAREWGLVLEVVEDADLKSTAQRIGEGLSRAHPQAFRRAKGLLAMVDEQPLSASLEAEITALEAHYHSSAFQSGIQYFLNKRRSSLA